MSPGDAGGPRRRTEGHSDGAGSNVRTSLEHLCPLCLREKDQREPLCPRCRADLAAQLRRRREAERRLIPLDWLAVI